jgi:outer membrane protein OmpA-like peptidoglycan-associated protein
MLHSGCHSCCPLGAVAIGVTKIPMFRCEDNIMKRQPKNLRSPVKPFRYVAALLAPAMVSGVLTPVSFANVIGSDMQNFNATTSGLDFVTVESAATLEPGFANFGLFMNYAVNTLPYFEKTDTIQSRTKFNDTILGADLNVGYGVTKRFDLGLSLPQVVSSTVKTSGWNGKFRDNGNTEIRTNAKYQLAGDEKGGTALQGVVNFNRTKDNPYVGESNSPIYSLVLISSKQITHEMGLGVNLGYRWRKAGAPLKDADPIKPLPNQFIWSGAMSYHIASIDSKIIAEVFGSNPVKKIDTNSDRTASSAETLLGIKHDIDTNLSIHGGIGTEIDAGLSSPDWRAYLGINWSTGPQFDKPARISVVEPPVKAEPVAKPFAIEPKPYENITVHDIMFEFASDHLIVGQSKQMLKELADHLNQPPKFTKLIIVGHTDSIGSAEYNETLSKRRADTIRNWLISEHKLDAAKISTEGHGEREPVAGNGNYQGRQMNRRVEFRIYREGMKEEIRSTANPKAAEGAKDPGEKVPAPKEKSKAKAGKTAKPSKK